MMVVATSDVSDAPWNAYEWCGKTQSLDGTETTHFAETDVARVVAYGSVGDRWDGESACIVLLKDGRYAGWESWYGPTGSGFEHDAYGGDAEILFASDVEVIRSHLTERAREILHTTAILR